MTKHEWIDQIDASLQLWTPIDRARKAQQFPIDHESYAEFVSRGMATIERIAGRNSVYSAEATKESDRIFENAPRVAGALRALRSDVQAGYTLRLAELIHADLFADYMEMASHLLQSGYQNAAAVIGGSTLEAHLRRLAVKNGVATTSEKNGDEPKPRKAETLNADLVKANAYGKLEQKYVTAWLDLRNNAAHGHYEKYSKEQVDVFLSGIRQFMTANPA
jgi:hypothetical protein